ncbi:MAG: hypothetical protein Q9191_006417, partial [Dirinaria sp. TL-2023a]
MASPGSLKRSYADADLENAQREPQPAQIAQSPYLSQASPFPEAADIRNDGHIEVHAVKAERSRPSSPALSQISSSALGELGAQLQPSGTDSGATTKKARKARSALEREVNQLVKEEKEEKRRRKIEERTKRDIERLARDIGKAEKRKAKEEEKKAKEDDKRKKEEEQAKKDRSQLRLNAFFAAPRVPTEGSKGSPVRDMQSPANSRRSSISSIQGPGLVSRERSISTTPQKAQMPDYERLFPPFFVQSHTVLASSNRFSRDDQGIEYVRAKLDQSLRNDPEKDPSAATKMSETLRMRPRTRRLHQAPQIPVKEIVARIHGTANNPIDLTSLHSQKAAQAPIELLKSIPVKFLKFAEDVRPPLIGTYTRPLDARSRNKLSKNPFTRALPTDYDYDSEAEWEEPGEGEDLDSEGEEELGEDEEADDMEGFLDDAEADEVKKRRPVISDLEPTYNPQLPIDPYSTAYWQTQTSATPQEAFSTGSMEPPLRVPLTAINRQNLQLPTTSISPSDSLKNRPAADATPPTSTKPAMKQAQVKRYIASELIDDFKAAVQGSELTKLGLVEVLKK